MACWEYTLTGFGDFLEQRRLAFTEPMPPSRVCSMCGRVPSGTALLPCGHVLCGECQGEVLDRMECPFEGKAFTEGQLVRLRFELSDVEQLPVVCIIGGRQCATFSGKLFELKDHMRQCRSVDVQCVKCHRSIASEVAVKHYRQCYTEIVPRPVVGGQHVDDDLVNGTNGLVKKLACLDHALSEVQKVNASAGHERCPLSLGIAPGPFRAASKPGLFITSCKFSNVDATRDALNGSNKKCVVSSQICTLAGYTFKVHCIFLLIGNAENEEVNVSFRLHLKGGDWDEHIEWPFTKKVTLILAHPTDETKDIRLTSVMDGQKLTRKPRLNEWNWGRETEDTSWKDIELKGFVVKDALYVNVEFE
ncbi:hypothetical protein MRX96_000987 [Rhipicephalus microplus]